MNTSIEVVSHCYAIERAHYAASLCYHLSSLMDNKNGDVRATICWCKDDSRVQEVLGFFASYSEKIGVKFKAIGLTRDEFSRRAIGRNRVALTTKADIVWFSDCDQVFGREVFAGLRSVHWPPDVTMMYPKRIKIHRDHETGDKALAKVEQPGFVKIDKAEFADKGYSRAIGGVQIVRGDFARRFGYLKEDEKWQEPIKVVLGDFRDDIAYRRFCGQLGEVKGIDLPGMYRIRHSTTSYQ